MRPAPAKAPDASAARKTPARKARGPSPAERAAARQNDLLQRYDKNGDGRIDEDERVDAKEEMLKENVDRQMARIAAAQASPEQVRARLLALFDQNKDGELDEDERALAQKFAEERSANPTPMSAALREQLIKRFDKNANGRIEPEERQEMLEFLQQRGSAMPPGRAPSPSPAKSPAAK